MSSPSGAGRTRVAAVVGPTAVGKSEVAIEVAEALGTEIVSIDSMQTYEGMDIGTAKAPREMRVRVPHHLLDVLPPSHDLTVSEFQELARAAIEEVASRDRIPLLVGGSGLYFRAVVDDLRFPPRSAAVRRALEEESGDIGPEALHARLMEIDPRAAAKIEPANARRTIRALEVIEITGRLFSENDAWERYESIFQLAVAGLERPRVELYERIEQRVEEMLRLGLVAEVERLRSRGMSGTARQSLGYRQVLEEGSDASTAVLRDEIAAATKRFARRQESWFRSDPRVAWFQASDPVLTRKLIEFFSERLGPEAIPGQALP